MNSVYYNEFDKSAAAWLRELIRRNLIAPGDVDERSIIEVEPNDLRGYTQCHFFAGIGIWSYALRSAGWSDDRPVWTGSCPCQPFSAAGKGEGYADERHLWPHWHRLISECRPATIFGEQVDAAIRTGWLDDVCLSLEQLDYTVGAVSFPACSVGAPHIRQRVYFVADAEATGSCGRHDWENGQGKSSSIKHGFERLRTACDMGNAEQSGSQGHRRLEQEPVPQGREGARRHGGETGILNGFWSNVEWLPCRDGKARPTEPGTFPLAHGAAARVVRLRGYGNAIVAPQAQIFIESVMGIDE